jgi:hypothetical protein
MNKSDYNIEQDVKVNENRMTTLGHQCNKYGIGGAMNLVDSYSRIFKDT